MLLTNPQKQTIFILLVLGTAGILSAILFNEAIPANIYVALEELIPVISPKVIFLLIIFIPLVVFIVLGTILQKSIEIEMPILDAIVNNKMIIHPPKHFLTVSVLAGLFISVLLLFIYKIFYLIDSNELLLLKKESLIAFKSRLFFRVFTETIIVYYGFMSLFIWVSIKIFKKKNGYVYFVIIVLASILISLIQYFLLDGGLTNVGQSSFIITYILLTKTLVSIILGWLYWKFGVITAISSRLILGLILIVMF